jgi:hypothetical protein
MKLSKADQQVVSEAYEYVARLRETVAHPTRVRWQLWRAYHSRIQFMLRDKVRLGAR